MSENLVGDRISHLSKRTRLSSQTVEALRPPAASHRLEIADTGCAGLRLRVSPHGSKTWSVVYRVAGEGAGGVRGRPRRATLGAYPLVSLDQARSRARTAYELADRGKDFAQAKSEVANPQASKVEAVCADFVERYAKRRVKEWRNVDRWLSREVVPRWRTRDIATVTRGDVHELLDSVRTARSAPAAIEVRKHLSKLFNWAVDQGKLGIASNPISGMHRPERYRPRERTLDVEELQMVWIASEQLGYPFREFFRLLILTGQRRGEIAALKRSWMFRDQRSFQAVRVPASSYKTGRAHEVPLTDAAMHIIDSMPIWSAGDHLLSNTAGKVPISGFSKAKARLDLILANQAAAQEVAELLPWTIHDIRRSVATGMAQRGVPVEHVERVLGHALGGVAGIYNHHRYLDEKRAALETWAAALILPVTAVDG